MKTTAIRTWTAIGLSVLTTVAFNTMAGGDACCSANLRADKTYTGTVASIAPKEQVIKMTGFFGEKRFELGKDCAYTVLDKNAGIRNLRSGQRVMLTYEDVNGVRVVKRVTEIPRRYEGTVKSVDLKEHTLSLRMNGVNREFAFKDDCLVMMRNHRTAKLTELKPGDRVKVRYETPEGNLCAREIAQLSDTFHGELTAIDVGERTVKAKATLESKRFNVASDCEVVIPGKDYAHLRDLKPGDKVKFNYDEVNGVNVVSRITRVEQIPTEPVTARYDRD
jgi:Cu/Ag efflux protein CusF